MKVVPCVCMIDTETEGEYYILIGEVDDKGKFYGKNMVSIVKNKFYRIYKSHMKPNQDFVGIVH